MHPIICKIGPFTIFSYGVMMALAVLICSFLLSRDFRRLKKSEDFVFDFVFWIVVGGITGARLFYIVLNPDYFRDDLLETIRIQNGGLAWQGGFAGAVLTGLFLIRKNFLPLWETLDLAAPYIALGQSIGRIGCFLNGCCYGKEVSWGIYFPVYHARLHPTQLYESASLLMIFLILKRYQAVGRSAGKPAGRVFILYLVLASLERFIVEFFRADHVTMGPGLSIFQMVSLIFFFSALYANTFIKSR